MPFTPSRCVVKTHVELVSCTFLKRIRRCSLSCRDCCTRAHASVGNRYASNRTAHSRSREALFDSTLSIVRAGNDKK